MIPRTEILINDLCDEIDYYKEQVEYYKKRYEEYAKKYSELLDSSLKYSAEMSGIMIKSIMAADQEKLSENFGIVKI